MDFEQKYKLLLSILDLFDIPIDFAEYSPNPGSAMGFPWLAAYKILNNKNDINKADIDKVRKPYFSDIFKQRLTEAEKAMIYKIANRCSEIRFIEDYTRFCTALESLVYMGELASKITREFTKDLVGFFEYYDAGSGKVKPYTSRFPKKFKKDGIIAISMLPYIYIIYGILRGIVIETKPFSEITEDNPVKVIDKLFYDRMNYVKICYDILFASQLWQRTVKLTDNKIRDLIDGSGCKGEHYIKLKNTGLAEGYHKLRKSSYRAIKRDKKDADFHKKMVHVADWHDKNLEIPEDQPSSFSYEFIDKVKEYIKNLPNGRIKLQIFQLRAERNSYKKIKYHYLQNMWENYNV